MTETSAVVPLGAIKGSAREINLMNKTKIYLFLLEEKAYL